MADTHTGTRATMIKHGEWHLQHQTKKPVGFDGVAATLEEQQPKARELPSPSPEEKRDCASTCGTNCGSVFNNVTLSFRSYDLNWPLAFGVSSLDCLGAGGKDGKKAKWSMAYFAIRVVLFLIMFATLIWSMGSPKKTSIR